MPPPTDPARTEDAATMELGSRDAGAVFDASMRYRFVLWRDWTPPWQQRTQTVAFIMLNPSTADHEQLDPTVRRCIDFAKRWGYDRLHVVNLFPLRATNPRALVAEPAGIRHENDSAITFYAGDQADLAIAAWGAHPMARGAFERIQSLVQPRALRVLGLTKAGHPRHPLYMPRDCGHHALDDLVPA